MPEEFAIRWEVEEISKLTTSYRFSPYHYHHGIPWRLMVRTENSNRTDNTNHCSLYLCCHNDIDCGLWSVECLCTLTVIHRDDPEKNKGIDKFTRTFRAPAEWGWGRAKIVDFAKLLKRSEGFVIDDKIIVEGRATIKNFHCIRPKPTLDFYQPMPDADNIALKFDDGTLHVCRKYLMWHSPYFASLFMEDELDKEEIKMKDVKVENFNELLQVIFPSERPINEDSFSVVLKLASRFQIECALDAVEKFLMKSKKVQTATKMLHSEQYGMESLMKQCMNSLNTLQEVKALESASEFSRMSVSLKVSLLAKVFQLLKPTE